MDLSAQLQSRVIVANESKIASPSTYGTLAVGTAVTEVSGISAETSLFLQAHKDVADVLYLGLDNLVSSANHFATLTAGEKLEITMNVVDPVHIFVVGTNAGDKICYLEGVN